MSEEAGPVKREYTECWIEFPQVWREGPLGPIKEELQGEFVLQWAWFLSVVAVGRNFELLPSTQSSMSAAKAGGLGFIIEGPHNPELVKAVSAELSKFSWFTGIFQMVVSGEGIKLIDTDGITRIDTPVLSPRAGLRGGDEPGS